MHWKKLARICSMVNEKIENYLVKTRLDFDCSVLDEIDSLKNKAIGCENEEKANYYWVLEHIFKVKAMFVNAFNKIRSKEYEEAWDLLDKTDILISQLSNNCDGAWLNKFDIGFVKEIIPEYQKLFPYYLFSSREGIIKKEVCSICGQEFKLRGGCKHRVGKLYMGEICYAEVKEYDLKCIAIVTNPFDKYAVLRFQNQDFNYSVLEKAITKIVNPYQRFKVDKKYITKKEVEQKHTIEWLKTIDRIDYSIEIDE